MCLLVLAWRVHARYRLVVAANRDEFHARAAAPLAKWPPPAELLAGRDLRSQGTWLGIDRARRFGVVTNFRELQPPRTGAPSRGDLVPGFLAAHGEHPAGHAGDFLAALEPRAAAWSGFNLLLADADALWYASNRTTPFARELGPGVYGLANESLDTPWPKLQRVRSGFETWLWPLGSPADTEGLFTLLADRTPAQDPPPADSGALPREWSQALSAPFVLHPEYGTRCSTVLLLEGDGRLQLVERRFDPGGRLSGETAFRLQAGEWP
jgi:uncharacterized protein with NRDE domain